MPAPARRRWMTRHAPKPSSNASRPPPAMGIMGSSINSEKKLGSSTGAGGGKATRGLAGAEAGSDAGAALGSEAAATGAGAASLAGAAGTSADAGASAWGTAGADGSGVAAGVGGGTGTVTPGALAAAAGAAPTEADAVPSLFSSLMFLDNSSTRAAACCDCLRLASSSSVAFWPLTAPLERVSLSGAALAGRWSCTCA